MSHSSTPQPSTPTTGSSTPNSFMATAKTVSQPKNKPINVFSNDGSFLERFQRSKMEEEEKKKQEDTLKKKREFDERFKNRRKRPHQESNDAPAPLPDDHPSKKVRPNDIPLTRYEKELTNYSGKILKDGGTGVRSLIK